jgi:hypothetical protein
MKAHANFISESSSLAITLPDSVDPQPTLVGVVALDGGFRSIVFQPFSRRPDPRATSGLLHGFDVVYDARTVSVFATQEDPSSLVGFWKLSNGYLSTFIQDQMGCGDDPAAAIRTVIENIEVQETKFGLPSISFRPPLTHGDIRDPRQREAIVFVPQSTPGWPDVSLERLPTWSMGRRRTQEMQGTVHASSSSSTTNIDVQVVGPAEHSSALAGHADAVSQSIAPILACGCS